MARLVSADAPSRMTREQRLAAGTLRAGRGDPLEVEPMTAPPGTPTTGELLGVDRIDR
ncbi:MAG: hypothetical protein LH469_01415 [Frankiaceae bacterium]|nr:hypothetical protein [Frankiaceae bacterium]